MKLILLLITLFSFNTSALEYSLEIAQSHTTMEWKGVSHAKYNYRLKTIGAVIYHESGFGVRTSYGKGRATLPQPGAAIPHLIIELKHAIDLEVLYRHNLYGETYAYWSAGYFWDHLPVTSNISDYYKDDHDNGVGASIGIEHKMNKYMSVFANYRVRNIIGPNAKHNGALGSSHTGYGVGIKFTF